MSEYNAGAARGTWTLDTSQGDRAIAATIQRLKQFEREQQRVLGAARGGAVGPRLADEARLQQLLARTAQAEARKAAEVAKATLVDQRAAAVAAQISLAEQRRQTELAKTARAEAQAAAATERLAASRRRASQGDLGPALPRTFAGFTPGGLAQAAGAFGLATIGPQLIGGAIGGGIDAGRDAIVLEQTRRVLEQLSGSQERYALLTRIAADNQRLFGGSLQSNLSPLTSVLALSNQTGASLTSLNQATQLLLAKAPTKNTGDAFFGLGEFLSANGAEAALSLADQFNLNKQALAALAAEGTTAEQRLRGLLGLLAEQGVTAETLAARLTDSAVAFNGLNAELDTLRTNAGAGLAAAFTPAAAGLQRIIGLINDNPQAIAELRALLTGQAVTPELIAEVEREVATRQAQAGGSVLRQQQVSQATVALNQAGAGLAEGFNVSAASAAALSDQLARLNQAASGAQRATIEAAAAAFLETGNAQALAQALGFVEQAQAAAAAGTPAYIAARVAANRAARDDADAQRAAAQATNEVAVTQALANARAEQQAAILAELDAAARAAAAGAGTIEQAAARLADQFPIATEEAIRLISILRELSATEVEPPKSLKQQENEFRVNPFAADAETRLLAEQQANLARARSGLLLERAEEQRLRATQRIADTEARILDLRERQAAAAVDAQLGAVRDAQARLKEAREFAANQRIIEGGQFSDEQKRAARLRNEEILLEQQKRGLDIQRDMRDAGPALPTGVTPALPPAAQLPPPAPITLNVSIARDGTVTVSGDAGVPLEILVNGAAQASSVGAGR